MQSFIVVSKDQQIRNDYAVKICQDSAISDFDITVIESDISIGIEEVRNLQKKLSLKPLQSKTKAAILKTSGNLTLQAQNALLKTLEEPPENTIIIITAPTKEAFLPTVLSRCKIIELDEKAPEFSEEEADKYSAVLMSLLSAKIGERLKQAQDLGKSREETTLWLEKMILTIRLILVTRQQAIDSSKSTHSNDTYHRSGTKLSISELANILKLFQKNHTIVKTTNINQRFALENLFLSLRQSSSQVSSEII